MKSLIDYIQEEGGMAGSGLCATPGNTMGMGNPMPAGVAGPKGSEPLSTYKDKKAKVKKEKLPKKKRKVKEEDMVSEAMKFPLTNFLAELSHLMARYKVTLVQDEEGTYFEDDKKHIVYDITNSYLTPEAMKKIAVNKK